MPRANRIYFPGAVYHIIQRGNNKQNIFVDDIDRWHFLKLLLEAKRKFGYLLYCYSLMHNHFHVTIEALNLPVSKIMQFVEGSYAAYFNKRHNHNGHLFQGRFKCILVEKDTYLLELSRYIHRNPVKAGYVSLPQDYVWSSYRIYIGMRDDILVDTNMLLSYFNGDNDRENAQKLYKNFIEDDITAINNEEDWLEKHLVNQRFLGSKDFIKKFRKRGQTPFDCLLIC